MCKHQSVRVRFSDQQCPAQVKQTRHLVLDSRIIDETVEAKLTLGEITKHPQNPLFSENKPLEPRFDMVKLEEAT